MSYVDFVRCMPCRMGRHGGCTVVVPWPGPAGTTPCRCACRKALERN